MDVARLAVGFFFAASGYHKLVNPARHATLVKTLRENHIPFVAFNQYWVPGVELAAGLGVMFGFLTHLSALGLIIICAVACFTDGRARVKAWQPIDWADWLDDWLYLPEVLYMLLLAYFVVYGGSVLSIDHYILPYFGL